jgi:hypothetical protein
VEETDLAISTMGRSFYILDDLGPLRQFGPQAASAGDAFLFAPDDAIRSFSAATIKYWVKQPLTSAKIEVIDKAGTVVRTFENTTTAAGAGAAGAGGQGAAAQAGGGAAGAAAGGQGAAAQGGGGGGRGGRGGGGGGLAAPTGAGFNTVTWDLRYPSASSFPGMILWGGGVQGPFAAPGTYTVRLTANGQTQTQTFRVRRNPLHKDVTDADLQAQFDLAIQIRDKTSEANNAVIQIRAIKSAVQDRLAKSSDARLKAAGDKLTASLSAVEGEIYQVKNQSGQDPLNFPIKVNNRLASLLSVVNVGAGRPIGNAAAIFKDLTAELKVLTDRLTRVVAEDLAAFNGETKRLGLDSVKDR